MREESTEKATLNEECQVYETVRKDLLGLELRLFQSKWFDYRFMSAAQATVLYGKTYAIVYRQFYGEVFDRSRSEFVQPLKAPTIFELPAPKLTGLWRGRQYADAMGVPYPLFLALAFKHALRFWKQPYLPQPQHLYSSRLIGYIDKDTGEGVVGDIQKSWEERQRAKLYVAEDPRYLNDRYAGTRAQNAHHEWLFQQAQLRENPLSYIADFVSRGLLPEAKVSLRLSADEFERYRSYS